MTVRKAASEEMLKLWGYEEVDCAPPTARYFHDNISSGNALFYTIENDGQLIGELYAFLDIADDRDFADGTTTAYLCAFRVKKEYRGKGLGTGLMEYAITDLRAMGFRHATIGVSENDERNRKLYERMGFTRKIKDCNLDPCSRDADMKPEYDEETFRLIEKDL